MQVQALLIYRRCYLIYFIFIRCCVLEFEVTKEVDDDDDLDLFKFFPLSPFNVLCMYK